MRDPVKRALAALGILLPISMVLLILFRGTVRETIVVPLLYLAWLSGLTFNSIHQAIFWGLLLALTAALLFSSLRSKPEARTPLYWPSDVDRRESRRVAFWARQFAHDRHDLLWNFQSRLEFRKLILAVWASRRRADMAELEQQIKAGAVELPPELRAYFEPDRRPYMAEMRYFERAVGWLRTRAGRRNHAAAHEASEAALAAAVRTLESEIGTDGPTAFVAGADRGSGIIATE